jgi:hypothetical protein
MKSEPFICPACGESLHRGAKACHHCGACERSGWSENSALDGLDLPDGEDFDYERFVEEEFGARKAGRTGVHPMWTVAAIIVLAAMVLLVLSGMW